MLLYAFLLSFLLTMLLFIIDFFLRNKIFFKNFSDSLLSFNTLVILDFYLLFNILG